MNSPEEDVTSITRIDFVSPSIAKVSYCREDNLIRKSPGPDGVAPSDDDEVDGSYTAYARETKWTVIDGTWYKDHVIEGTAMKADEVCGGG